MSVIPARAGKPKDKALVEAMVNHAYRKIFAPMRHDRVRPLGALNAAIKQKLKAYHRCHFQGRDYSREDLFVTENPTSQLLCEHPFEINKRRRVTAHKNAHVYLSEDKHYYRIPYQWIERKVMIIYTVSVVKVFAANKLIASHLRNRAANKYTTVKEHLPSHQKHYADRSPEYYEEKADVLGAEAVEMVTQLLTSKAQPEQAYTSCDGVLALARKTTNEEFTAACRIALEAGQSNYSFVKRVIQNGMALSVSQDENEPKSPPPHANTRGKQYYQNQNLKLKLNDEN
jgi:transposase